jgi:hypothetical protein
MIAYYDWSRGSNLAKVTLPWIGSCWRMPLSNQAYSSDQIRGNHRLTRDAAAEKRVMRLWWQLKKIEGVDDSADSSLWAFPFVSGWRWAAQRLTDILIDSIYLDTFIEFVI